MQGPIRLPLRACLLGVLVLLSATVGMAADGQAKTSQNHFKLQVVVDFYDDLITCHFTEKTLQEMMRIFQTWGVTRVYWNGQSYASGLYDAASNPGMDTNALRTYRELGEFIPAATRCAHQHGIELYVEFKPFDMYFPLLVPHDMSLFRVRNTQRKGIPALGGAWQMGSTFAEEHPEYLMARNMTGIRKGIEREDIATIKFVKQDAGPTGITKDNLQLYTSSDNHHYQRYDRPYRYEDRVEERPVVIKGVNLNRRGDKTEQVRVITLDGLAITEPYLAVSTKGKPGPPDFANVYYKLVEVYSEKGEPIPFAYGVPSPGADAWYPPELVDKRFPERGFMFDMSETLTANDVGFRADDNVGYLDSKSQVLGLAKGKTPYTTTLCPAHPEVRQYWLDQIQEFIDWGVDGVEFRWAAHQDTREWDAYGFNEPVVAEYQKRCGLDIRHEDFDRTKWRQLRGEYYTQFLRDAKTLLAEHDKKMMVDVMPSNNADPARPQFLNLHLDWPRWFSFADGVSFKWVPPDHGADAVFRKVADRHRIPTYYNAWPQVVYRGWDARKITDHIRSLKAVGHRGFMLYESWAFMRAKPDGTFKIIYPEIPNTIAPAVKEMNKGSSEEEKVSGKAPG